MKLNQALIKEINLALSVSFACLLTLETLWPGSVLAYINLNYWLILWLLSVILLLFKPSFRDNLHDGHNN